MMKLALHSSQELTRRSGPTRRRFSPYDDSIVITHDFLSSICCDAIITICEDAASTPGEASWENDSVSYYHQATCDMEVEKNLVLASFLKQIGLVDHIDRVYNMHYGRRINSFDDFFVVKYAAEGLDSKSELPDHIDAGDLSFMIALSKREDYEGGGTFFRVTNDTIHLSQGSMIVFDAKLFHRGEKITRGLRYLLVGFCHTDICDDGASYAEATVPIRGNLTRDLRILS